MGNMVVIKFSMTLGGVDMTTIEKEREKKKLANRPFKSFLYLFLAEQNPESPITSSPGNFDINQSHILGELKKHSSLI